MRRQHFPRFLDRFDQRVAEFLVSEMFAHCIYEPLPKLLPTLLMDRFVADHGELVRARRHENEDSVAFWRFVHAEPIKFLLRGDQRIRVQLSALNVNSNLAGSF